MKFINGSQYLVRTQFALVFIVLAAFLCPSENAAGQIDLIHVTSCGPASFPSSCTIPATGSGHLQVVGFTGGLGSNAVVSSVTYNAGNTYTEAGPAKASVSGDGLTPDIRYVADSNAGATPVTITASPQGSQGAVSFDWRRGGKTYRLNASPTSLSFGNVTVGTQSVLPIILTNTGTGAVTITQDTITGAGFSGSGLSLPLTLAAGQNTDLSITFAPTATGSATGSASVVSNASGSPAVVSLSGAGVDSHYVDLTWTASTSSGVTGYDIYRGTASGGPYSQINSSLVAGPSYTDSTVEAGQTYYYVAKAVNSSGAQSGYSTQASATVPSS